MLFCDCSPPCAVLCPTSLADEVRHPGRPATALLLLLLMLRGEKIIGVAAALHHCGVTAALRHCGVTAATGEAVALLRQGA